MLNSKTTIMNEEHVFNKKCKYVRYVNDEKTLKITRKNNVFEFYVDSQILDKIDLGKKFLFLQQNHYSTHTYLYLYIGLSIVLL